MSSHRSISLHVPPYVLWLLAFLVLAPWIAIGVWFVAHDRNAPPAQPEAKSPTVGTVPASSANRALETVPTKPGRWGELSTARVLIEPPEEFILSNYTRIAVQPWLFLRYTEQRLAALWTEAGLTPEQLAQVNDPARREVTADGIAIRPSTDLILSLSPAARSKIYIALSEFPENDAQHNPFRIRSNIAENWFATTELPESAVALTRQLMYPRGVSTCFSDQALILPQLASDAERALYLKVLSRKSALLVQLNVRPGQDVSGLIDYWGRGGRSKDLKPLLQSLARRSDGGAIDVVHLIPRFARKLLYTYPLPSEDPNDGNHDCHWTSLNFNNDQPDERFADINHVRQVLLSNYYPVLGEPMLGDLLLFVKPDGVVLHSCVYIADDIVFTKNGPAFSIPWLLSTLEDVKAFYDAPGLEIRRYRAKGL